MTAFTEIYYDPDPQNTVIEEDREFVSTFFEIPDEVGATLHHLRCPPSHHIVQDFPIENMSPWVLRIVLDRFKKEDKGSHAIMILMCMLI